MFTFLRTMLSMVMQTRRVFLLTGTYKKRLEFVKKTTRINKGLLVEHVYVASKHHRDLKEAVEVGDVEKIREAKNKLDSFFGSSFVKIFRLNASLLLEYFDATGRSSFQNPRVSIKVPRYSPNSVLLHDFVRHNCPYETSDFSLNANSAIEAAHKTNCVKIVQNIPLDMAEGLYQNKRLDIEKVKKYARACWWRRAWRRVCTARVFGKIDKDWVGCWKPSVLITTTTQEGYSNGTKEAQACYKSTFVMPLSIDNTEIDRSVIGELRNLEKMQVIEGASVEGHAPTHFGFLLIDHHWKDYFDAGVETSDSEDQHIIHIIGSMLTLALFIQWQYTTYSRTYRKASVHIKNDCKSPH